MSTVVGQNFPGCEGGLKVSGSINLHVGAHVALLGLGLLWNEVVGPDHRFIYLYKPYVNLT